MKYIAFLLLFISVSATAQWHRLPGPPAGGPISYTQSSDGKTIFAATPDGLWRAARIDGPWTPFGFRGEGIWVIGNFSLGGQDIFFVDNDTAVWRSVDTGKTWQAVWPHYHGLRVGTIFQEGTKLTIVTDTGALLSTDAGTTWNGMTAPPFGVKYSLTVTPTYTYAIANNQIWRQSRSGGAWLKTPFPDWQKPLSITSFGTNVFAGANGRVYLSTDDGDRWIETLSYGLDTNNDLIKSIAVNGLTMVATAPTGVYTSTDGARTWSLTMEEKFAYASYFVNNTFVVSRLGAGLFASSDGSNWYYVRIPNQATHIDDAEVSENALFTVTTGSVFRSTDRGASWSIPGNTGFINTLATGDSAIFALGDEEVSMWSHNRWNKLNWTMPVSSFAATNDTLFLSTPDGNIYRSEDTGGSWHALQNIPSGTGFRLLTIGDTLLYVTSQLHVSTDHGDTWTLRSSFQLGGQLMNVKASGNTIAVQSTGSLEVSKDGGWTWQSYKESSFTVGIVNQHVIAPFYSKPAGLYDVTNGLRLITDTLPKYIYSITSDDSNVYLASDQGLWANASSNLPLSVRSEHSIAQMEMGLYPNPSRISSMLRFELPGRGYAKLEVFNSLGNTVSLIDLGMLEVGEHTLPLETSALTNGIYSVRISTESSVSSSKLVVSH